MKKDYQMYLEKLGHSSRTIYSNIRKVHQFTQWSKTKRTKVEKLTYRQLLNYITHLKVDNTPKSINFHIWAIKHYMNFLIEKGYRSDNIAEGIKVRGARKKILHNLLTSDELEDLFYSYTTDKVWKDNFYFKATAKRNKVIVGLLVYQGLLSVNFNSLEVSHVDIRKGIIFIPTTKKNAWRKLELKPWQIIEFKEYIEDVRPILQQHTNNYTEKLFPINTPNFHTILNTIIKQLKTYNQKVTNNTHIRSSVIVNWLGQYNIRKVQQMAGHRHISSTESYQQGNLESLQESVNQYHPLN